MLATMRAAAPRKGRTSPSSTVATPGRFTTCGVVGRPGVADESAGGRSATAGAGAATAGAGDGRCRFRTRAVVGEELLPALAHRRRVGQVLLVHLVDEPLVRTECLRGVFVSHRPSILTAPPRRTSGRHGCQGGHGAPTFGVGVPPLALVGDLGTVHLHHAQGQSVPSAGQGSPARHHARLLPRRQDRCHRSERRRQVVAAADHGRTRRRLHRRGTADARLHRGSARARAAARPEQGRTRQRHGRRR